MHLEPNRALAESSDIDLEDTILTRLLEARRQCCVLVVDDDDLVRSRLASQLKACHYDVEVAASGKEALRVLAETHCHIVLTDWQMPDMDGLTLCRRVRLAQKKGYVYVLMLTVRNTKEDILAGLAAGADDYVVKGAPMDEILARLEVGRRITHVEHSLRATNREHRRLSLTDSLTGAYNLRHFVKYLSRELKRSQRYGHPLAVLSCDIDEFKQVNDRFGHEAGDELLREFVVRSESCIRKDSDWLARVGGDEFMIVLPETTAGGAKQVAQKLFQVFAMEPVLTRAGPISFTVSIGVTGVEAKHEPDSSLRLEDLIRAADRGMYASKRLGGDQSTADMAACKSAFDAPAVGKNGIN